MIRKETKLKVPEILRLQGEGMYAPQIAKIVGLNAMTVYKVIKEEGKTRKRNNWLNEKTFEVIKYLLTTEINQKDIAKIVKRSPSTVCYVKKCETLDDYKKLLAEVKRSKEKVVEEKKPEVTLEEVMARLEKVEEGLNVMRQLTIKKFRLF